MENIIEIKNSLIEHKLSILRDKNTTTKDFRELVSEISTYLCYEAMKHVELEQIEIETPITKMKTNHINEDKYVFIPILRAGLGMLDGALKVLPNASVGHIGMYRDEITYKPVNYYFKIPKDIENKEVILLDPMLATGSSAIDAIEQLKRKGVGKITFLCIISSKDGLKEVIKKHSDIKIYTASIDEYLNEKKYIVPGLGDAGDRIFGTK